MPQIISARAELPESIQALTISKSLNLNLNLSEYFDQEKIAEKLILLEIHTSIQVEGFWNLK